MRLTELEDRLKSLDGSGPLTLTAAELGITGAQELFENNLPNGTLSLDAAKGDVAHLGASGNMVLPGVGSGNPLPAGVTFAGDRAKDALVGIEILVKLDVWTLSTHAVTVDMGFLKGSKVSGLSYALSVEPGTTVGTVTAGAGVQAVFPFETKTGSHELTLTAEAPAYLPGQFGGEPNWSLEADVDLPLAELGELAAALATGLDPEEFELPQELLGKSLALRHLRLLGNPTNGLVAAFVEVEIFDKWTVVAEKCELREGRVAFTITSPTGSPGLLASAFATLELGGVPLSASVSVPELEIEAWLDEPISADGLFQTFLPGAKVPLEITRASLGVLREKGAWVWDVRFGVDAGEPGGWKLPGGIALTDLETAISGGGGSAQASLQTTLEIGNAVKILLGGEFNTASSIWSLSGSSVGTLDAGRALEDLANQFGVELPAPLAKLELKTIELLFEEGKKTEFHFLCAGEFPLAGAQADFTAGITMTWEPPAGSQDKGSYSLETDAKLTLNLPAHPQGPPAEKMEFEVKFAKKPEDTRFTALWEDTEAVSLDRVLEALGVDSSLVPDGLLPEVKKVSFGYDTAGDTLVLAVETVATDSIWSLTTPTGKSRTMTALVHAKTEFHLSDVPIVGPSVPPADDVELDVVELFLSSGPLGTADVGRVNELVPSGLPTLPSGNIEAATAVLTLSYHFGDEAQKPLVLPLAGGKQPPGPGSPPALAPQPPSAGSTTVTATEPPSGGPPTVWLKPQRTFGPLTLERVGASYAEGDLWLMLDGGVADGGLSLGLQGLAVGFPLSTQGPWTPRVKLRGIGVGYSEPPLEIAGALLFVTPQPPVKFEVAGLLSAGTDDFTMSVSGAYAQTDFGPAMFAMGAFTGDLGGPPPVFVTGLAGGFGYQSSLRLPAQGEIGSFPLVRALADPQSFAAKDPVKALTEMAEGPEKWVRWQPGALWFAAGVQFSSFDLVSTTAVLVGELGEEVTIALIGTSTATFPRGAAESDTYAKVILDLEAIFRPSEGSFEASALLAPGSFVIDPACALTGGFAFSLWYGPSKHAGDFVVTLGGYHPAFKPPPWYPQEPRLGFSWSVRDELTIAGSAYFALTPSAVMAGGELNVAYHDGDLKAWLRAYADALIWFKPFSFAIEIGISVGASYTLSVLGVHKTLSAELGAELELWGPPTAGRVTIHWWVISFTVSFGDGDPKDRNPLHWPEFEELLPPRAQAIRLTPVAAAEEPEKGPWIAAAYGFSFSTMVAMPATELRGGSAAAHRKTGSGAVSIQPMQTKGVSAVHTVKVMSGSTELGLEDWRLEPIVQSVPKALWGEGDGSQLVGGEEQVVPEQLVGYRVTVPPPREGGSPGAVSEPSTLAADPLPAGTLPLKPGEGPSGPVARASTGSIHTIATEVGTSAKQGARHALGEALEQLGCASLPDDSLTSFAAKAGHAFSNPPLVGSR